MLYSFCRDGRGCGDGESPQGGVIKDKAGNLYGVTLFGGGTWCDRGGGCGTIFKLAPDGTETVLHAFQGGARDGAYPQGVIEDKAGNLYGTTSVGGSGPCSEPEGGCGIAFEIAADGTETVLYDFAGGSDGARPEAGLIRDRAGNLYGTTSAGGGAGCKSYGCGTVFKLAPNGTETVLYAFRGHRDGDSPAASLIRDEAGNLYGTTVAGGGGSCYAGHGCGIIFKIAPDVTETVLYDFRHQTHDGTSPQADLMRGSDGQLYGTAEYGGVLTCISQRVTCF